MFEAHLQTFSVYLKQETDKLLIAVEVGPCTSLLNSFPFKSLLKWGPWCLVIHM